MLEYVEYIKKNKLGEVYLNKSFKDITTIKIGGRILVLYYPNTIENFISFYKFYLINRKYPITIIGNGSNILASSNDYNGIVVCFKKILFKYFLFKDIITINSGVMINDIINFLKKKNLGGLEKLYYIPATIGGMIKMNASAYKCNISDRLLMVKCLDRNGNVKTYKKEDIDFSYRKSNIPFDEIIIECTFKLEKKENEDIKNMLLKVKNERKNKQPLTQLNAGSTFMNPKNSFAWELIDNSGLRGVSINDAMVSIKHTNFLINKKDCSSDDMIQLIELIIEEVYKKFNIKLQCEWNFINFKKSIYFF